MCRIGARHLTNFWPVILAELVRSSLRRLPSRKLTLCSRRYSRLQWTTYQRTGQSPFNLCWRLANFSTYYWCSKPRTFKCMTPCFTQLAAPLIWRNFQTSMDVCHRHCRCGLPTRKLRIGIHTGSVGSHSRRAKPISAGAERIQSKFIPDKFAELSCVDLRGSQRDFDGAQTAFKIHQIPH